MFYMGNQYYSRNTILGCSSNIIYDITGDNTFVDNLSLSENHKDTVVFRDSLNGIKSEIFVDNLFVGLSNLDNIGTITP